MGVPIRSEAGCGRLERAVDALVRGALSAPGPAARER